MAPLVRRVAATASTMDDARALAAAGAAHGTVVRADAQTGGRGRAGRAWVSPPGGLWFSVVLRPASPPAAWSVLPLAAGCAVAAALAEGRIAARLKWPNDVLVDGRKAGGVLVEAVVPAAGGSSAASAVVGVGINAGVAEDALPPEVRRIAAALGLPPAEVDALFARIVDGLLSRVARLDAGDAAGIVAEWRTFASLGGRVARGGVEGVAVDVAEDGALVVETVEGRRVRVVEAD